MKLLLAMIRSIVIVFILTLITQVGGVIYLLYKPFGLFLSRKITHKWQARAIRWASFAFIYSLISLLLIPAIASSFGRVPMPLFVHQETPLKPANLLSCLMNRHYVKPELRRLAEESAQKLATKYPNSKLIYLDANFPFFNHFPLFPHLSHDDGEKLDIAFLYTEKSTGKRISHTISAFGYGIFEEAKEGQVLQADVCKGAGYWQYGLLAYTTWQGWKKPYEFDEEGNRFLLKMLAQDARSGKIFIEPHLKQRLGLRGYEKIRFHGCHAVRHDDHIHIQL